MNKRLYVGNLSYSVTSEQLKKDFSAAGEVADAEVICYSDSGRSKGFGFVEMATEEAAQEAIKMFDSKDHEGRTINVAEARPPREDAGGSEAEAVEAVAETAEEATEAPADTEAELV